MDIKSGRLRLGIAAVTAGSFVGLGITSALAANAGPAVKVSAPTVSLTLGSPTTKAEFQTPGGAYYYQITVRNVPSTASISLGVSGATNALCRQTYRVTTTVAGMCWVYPNSPLAVARLNGRATINGVTTYSLPVTSPSPVALDGATDLARIRSNMQCGNTTSKVWPTFDDGYISLVTAKSLVGVLNANHIKGRFFLVGSWANTTVGRQVVAHIKGNGHIVENHTYSHPHLATLSDAAVKSEIARGLETSSGAKLIRPPYGSGWNVQNVNMDAKALGYGLCYWSVDTQDWAGASADTMYNRVRYGDGVTPPIFADGVILMHANHYTADKLNHVIAAVKARGLAMDSK